MWELTMSGWQLICDPCAPGGRLGAGFAYDPNSGNVVLYGGGPAFGMALGETWLWDGSTWTQDLTAGSTPGLRERVHLIYDPMAGHLRLLGGGDGATPYTTSYLYTASGWVADTITFPQLESAGMSVAWDGTRFLLLEDDAYTLRDTLFQLAGGTISQVCSACSGMPRNNASIVHDTAFGKTLLINGYNNSAEIAGTWVLEGNAWQQLSTDPPQRDSSAVVYDPVRQVVVLYGGNGLSCAGGPYSNCAETWELVPGP
jgi:hypothetical protein